jgi:hypothetical protein
MKLSESSGHVPPASEAIAHAIKHVVVEFQEFKVF